MNIYSPVISGSLTVTGSTNFLGNVVMSGSLTFLSGSLTGTASNSDLLSGTGSVGFTTTGSFATMSGSVSSRVSQIETVYATTGSNSFRATQSITGSLTVTGQIIAQTLNVQQVTSSIVYSSGSNTFGCDINSRQTFTGSFYQTGSVAYFSGCVGVGSNSNNGYRLEVTNPSCATGYVNTFYGLHTGNNTFTIRQFGSSHPTAASVNQIGVLNAEQHLHLVTDTQACIDAGTSTKGIFLRCGGLVGIGTQSPNRLLTINGDSTLLGNNYISTNKFLQWEGGAYWTTRVTSTGNQFEIYRGDTGASPFVINSCNLPIFTCQVCAPRVSLNSGTSGTVDLGQINTGGVANQIVGGQFSGYAYVGKLSFNVGTWGAGTDYGPTEQMRIEVQGADTKKSQITMAPYGGLIVSCGDSYFCGSTYGIMGFGCKVFDKICYIMTTTGTVCVPLDGLVYGSGPTRAIYLYGTLLDNDAAHYAHMLYFYRNDYGGLQASTISQASLVHPSTAGQAYTFSVNDPVGIGKSACTLLLRFTSSGAGVAPGSYCTKMRIVVYNVPANA